MKNTKKNTKTACTEFVELMYAAGQLDKAARLLLGNWTKGARHASQSDLEAAGILTGLAYQVRPRLVR